MFAELPQLFDRDFAMAYFLPVVGFIAASAGLQQAFGNLAGFTAFGSFDTLVGTTVIVLISWLGGVLLLVMNRDLIRFLEGYGRLNPLNLLASFEKRRFRSLKQEISELDAEYKLCKAKNEDFPSKKQGRRIDIKFQLANEFPDRLEFLLPTGFGNAIRAFEVYSRVMYGIDSIPGWTRLVAVIPKEYRELVVDKGKVQVDFWVNVFYLGIGFCIEYLAMALWMSRLTVFWLPAIALFVAALGFWRSKNAAFEWGDGVKAAFDLYLPELASKLGFQADLPRDSQKDLWTHFSQALIYNTPSSLPSKTNPSTDVSKILRYELKLGKYAISLTRSIR
jgi:hypothetical protein